MGEIWNIFFLAMSNRQPIGFAHLSRLSRIVKTLSDLLIDKVTIVRSRMNGEIVNDNIHFDLIFLMVSQRLGPRLAAPVEAFARLVETATYRSRTEKVINYYNNNY